MCGRVAQYQGPVEYGSMLKIDWTKNLSGLPNTPQGSRAVAARAR